MFASRLPPLADDRVYQLWYARSGQFRPAGLLSTADGGHADVLDGRARRGHRRLSHGGTGRRLPAAHHPPRRRHLRPRVNEHRRMTSTAA
ncbi:anti-sigma factor domain-containing protein [Streptomyces purpurascens]